MRNIPVSVVVQGRFHAFALAKALIELEVPLEVVTNYPVFIAEKFGLPRSAIKSFPIHGVFHRYAYRWNLVEKFPGLERLLHTAFSKSVARHLAAKEPSVVHVFSGVALDIFSRLEQIKKPVIKMLARGSCHIRDQYLELCKEGKRAGVPIDKPSPWMMRRELNEYKRADKIVTLSSFAQQTFIRRGYTDEKIQLLPLGANTHVQTSPGSH